MVEEGEAQVKLQDWLIQPIAMSEVATVVTEVVDGQPGNRAVVGAEQIRLPELTRRLLAARGDEREVIAVDVALPSFSDGSPLAPEDTELVGPTPKKWITLRG